MFTVSKKELELHIRAARNYCNKYKDVIKVELFVTKNGKFKLIAVNDSALTYIKNSINKEELWPIGDFYGIAQMDDTANSEILKNIKIAAIMLADTLHYELVD